MSQLSSNTIRRLDTARIALRSVSRTNGQLRAYSQPAHSPDDSCNAWISRASPDRVAEYLSSQHSQAGQAPKGPLSGKRIGVKDNICTTDFPTTCASKILTDYVSPFDATVVKTIRDHGGFIAGKTNMDAFGMGSHSIYSDYGPVLNPIMRAEKGGEYSAGGSSGGSAVAVQNQSCDASLGTDTGGSVRLPAAFCGVVGFKPSYGNVSRYGVVPYANSLDTVGVLGRSVTDAQTLFEAIRGPDDNDPTCLNTSSRDRIRTTLTKTEKQRAKRRLRIGVPIEYNTGLDSHVRLCYGNALDALRRFPHLGFDLYPVHLPSTYAALAAYYVLAPAEASSNLAKYDGVRYGRPGPSQTSPEDVLYAGVRSDNLGSEVKRRIVLGSYTLSSTAIDNYFMRAQRVRRLVQHDFNQIFAMNHPFLQSQKPQTFGEDRNAFAVDVLLTPTAPQTAPELSEVEKMDPLVQYAYDVFTVPASLAGLPAVSVPVTNSHDTRSVGVQVIGQYGDDDFVLDVAQYLEEALQSP